MENIKKGLALGLFFMLMAALLVAVQFSFSAVADHEAASAYQTLSEENGTLELPVVDRHITYSGLYGRPHYCLQLDTGSGADEVEVSKKTYTHYAVGDTVSCVMDGTRIVINPA